MTPTPEWRMMEDHPSLLSLLRVKNWRERRVEHEKGN